MVGRTLPVDTKYVPCAFEGLSGSNTVGSYVSEFKCGEASI